MQSLKGVSGDVIVLEEAVRAARGVRSTACSDACLVGVAGLLRPGIGAHYLFHCLLSLAHPLLDSQVSEVVVPLLRYPTNIHSRRTCLCLTLVSVCVQYATIGFVVHLDHPRLGQPCALYSHRTLSQDTHVVVFSWQYTKMMELVDGKLDIKHPTNLNCP